jgi:hypothetical protein
MNWNDVQIILAIVAVSPIYWLFHGLINVAIVLWLAYMVVKAIVDPDPPPIDPLRPPPL